MQVGKCIGNNVADHFDYINLGAIRFLGHNYHPHSSLIALYPQTDLSCHQLLHRLKVEPLLVDSNHTLKHILIRDLFQTIDFAVFD